MELVVHIYQNYKLQKRGTNKDCLSTREVRALKYLSQVRCETNVSICGFKFCLRFVLGLFGTRILYIQTAREEQLIDFLAL